jgi:hypothetical protein
MNNLINFEQYNEGIVSSLNKRFNKNQNDETIESYLKDIKRNFYDHKLFYGNQWNSDKLIITPGNEQILWFSYILDTNMINFGKLHQKKKIDISFDRRLNKYMIFLDGSDITKGTNQYVIKDVFDFFWSRYFPKEKLPKVSSNPAIEWNTPPR